MKKLFILICLVAIVSMTISCGSVQKSKVEKREIRPEVSEFLGKETTDQIAKYLTLVRSWYDETTKAGDMNIKSVSDSYENAGINAMDTDFYADERFQSALEDYDVTDSEREFLNIYMPITNIGGEFAGIVMNTQIGGNIENNAWEKLGDYISEAEEFYYEGVQKEETATEVAVEEAVEEAVE